MEKEIQMPHTLEHMTATLIKIAEEFMEEGPGYAQERVVLREAAARLHIEEDFRQQQLLLTAWHKLFLDGKLSWGYNIDNPGLPFFHFPQVQQQ